MTTLDALAARLENVLETKSKELLVAGAVVGVAIDEERVVLAHGMANLNSGQLFTSDTGFLLGSATKVLVTTALLRIAERGGVELDARVVHYVPEFSLDDDEATGEITVRMLLNHTNGIDADGLMPIAVRGQDASESYSALLAGRSVLFEPGSCIHYSNPGFVLAARIIEEATGLPFERAIEEEVLAPCGMVDSTAVQIQAILRRTAIGAFADSETGRVRPTRMFSLPESLAGAGSTLIVTASDMLAFGRAHLNGGVAANGSRLLSRESVLAMQTTTFDMAIPQAPAVGLGWWLPQIADTTALWHGGGSPGGASSLCILPEYNCVVVSFVTGGGRFELNDLLHNAVIGDLTGRSPSAPLEIAPESPDPDVAGQYVSFQCRIVVERDGDSLLVTNHFEPFDEDHARQRAAYDEDEKPSRPVTYKSVAPRQFFRSDFGLPSLSGFFGRIHLLATLPAGPGYGIGLHSRLRYAPKVG